MRSLKDIVQKVIQLFSKTKNANSIGGGTSKHRILVFILIIKNLNVDQEWASTILFVPVGEQG